MAKTYIVGNWKLNFTVGESSIYLHKLMEALPIYRNLEIVVAPPTIALQPLSLQIDRHKLKLAAQNVFYRDFGAFTGETSCAQLRGIADYCLIGHAERRHIFHENDKDIQKKVAAAIRNRITPIVCVGETESERAFNETADVLRDQLLGALTDVSEEDVSKVIFIYDPVWAISSNSAARLATPDEVASAVKLLRETLLETYGKDVAENTAILFGGSINPSNAGAYLTVPGVNGLLMSNSSLILSEFTDIIEVAKRVAQWINVI